MSIFIFFLLERVSCFMHPGLCCDFPSIWRVYFHFLFLNSLNLSFSPHFTVYSGKPPLNLPPACTPLGTWSSLSRSFISEHCTADHCLINYRCFLQNDNPCAGRVPIYYFSLYILHGIIHLLYGIIYCLSIHSINK